MCRPINGENTMKSIIPTAVNIIAHMNLFHERDVNFNVAFSLVSIRGLWFVVTITVWSWMEDAGD